MPTTEQISPTFADLGLSQTVLSAIADMGYETPTPVQAAAIPEVLAGRDLLAAAQTGTGKTAAFLLPLMDKLDHVAPPVKKGERGRRRKRLARGRGPLMLVITPTRELAQQIDTVCHAVARRTGHVAVTVVGGVGYVPQKQALARGCDILVATPGRLVDLIEQGSANLDEVSVLVLDEADRMLDMGFLPQVRAIVEKCRTERQTLLFSATLDEGRVGSITDLVRDPARVEIAPVTSTAETVDQYVCPVALDAKNGALTAVLKKEGPERVIVFVRTKRRADTCARRLERSGIKCGAIHGDRSQAQRERALRDFREGKVQVLVATDVLARGIDISDVRYVVNFDVPEEPTDYIHRIGRTGRAGEEGWSLTFVTRDDIDEFFDIEALMGKTADLYDAEGIDLGSDAPRVDPDRVPADHVAGKKEKKRRRQKAKKANERRERREKKQRAPRQRDIARRAARDAARAAQEEAPEKTSRPSARKRPGKVRVREDEGVRTEARAEVEAAAPANRAQRRAAQFAEQADERGHRDRFEGSREGRRSPHSSARDRKGSARREDRDDRSARPARPSRDTWRNYDEPSSRERRAGKGGANRGGRGFQHPSDRNRSSRRPGDRGGRSSRH
ncbi:DEAD/DEAH box helicase [Collinsella ihumii]|uniref:DEAD/DEAH box helicase n=1 Tax=Collinsella ihumii TaxID=1720204 RepID=A0AAW7JZ31_9ACTN|nr:DEAD/DEAH box helicase [Collinsella ihumii]MDN0069770.1 DEAD/DEAH box helicase [Collinsella ihumii]